MGNQKLTPAEISQLMATYESELRKLEFQRGALTEAILKLQKQIGITEIISEPATGIVIEPTKTERKKPGPKAGTKKAAAELPDIEKTPKGKPGKKKSASETPAVPVAPAVEPTPEIPVKIRKPRASKQEAAPAVLPPPATKGKVGRPKTVKEAPVAENTPNGTAEKPKGKGRPPKSAAPSPEIAKTKVKAAKEKKVKVPKDTSVTETAGKIKAEEIAVKPEIKGKPGPKASYNKWDHFIFNLIKKVARPMTSADIIDAMKVERDTAKDPLGDTALAQQLNRTLTKLGGKLDLLKKEPYSGKGKVYSLKSLDAQLPE